MAGIRALLGLFPKTSEYESNRIKLEEEYRDLQAFKNSKELRDFHELEAKVNSEEFAQKKKEIESLRFKQTDDFQKEKAFQSLQKAKDIRLYYKTKGSTELASYLEISKSSDLSSYLELEVFVNSKEFADVKRETSISAKQKFAKSDLAKTLDLYTKQKNSAEIKAYYKFIKNKKYTAYLAGKESEIGPRAEALSNKIHTTGSKDKELVKEYKNLKKSKEYKAFHSLDKSPLKKFYEKLHESEELEAYTDLSQFINSEEYKRQKKEIESFSFKDTEEFQKLEKFNTLKNSSKIKFYFKFKESKALKNFTGLDGSERIKNYEELEKYIQSDEFRKFKAYCLKSPKKRWTESTEYEILQDYELKKKSEKIAWYYKNVDSKRFTWHRKWTETFSDEFSEAKVDIKKWLTRYYWGDKLLKDAYSLSQDKHFVTEGQNLHIENGRLHIVTKKEDVKGKSWHPTYGFITRDFGYTSGLVNTAKSFKQLFGTFEAKIRIHEASKLQNAFWMVGERMVPHIEIMKAGKKLIMGNYWGETESTNAIKNFKVSRSRSKFSKDFFIYTLEWVPGKLSWKINGVEVANSKIGVPEQQMYIALSAGLQEEVNGILPARMEVDWVRCYQDNELLNK